MAHETLAAPDRALPSPLSQSRAAISLSCQTIGVVLGLAEILGLAAFGAAALPLYAMLSGGPPADLSRGLGLGLLAGVLHAVVARSAGLYRLPVLIDPVASTRRLASVSLVVLLAITAVFFCLKTGAEFSRGALALFAATLAAGIGVIRLGAAALVAALMDEDAITGRPAFLLGDPCELAGLDRAYLLKSYGRREVGRLVFDPSDDPDTLRSTLAEVPRLAREAGARTILVATAWNDTGAVLAIEAGLRASPLPVKLVPIQRLRGRIDRTAMAGDPSRFLVTLQREPLSQADHALKRVIDVVLALFGLVVLSPVLLLSACAIKLDSRGPVLFRQMRTGFDHRPFAILKFRTMTSRGAEPDVPQATRHDARVTRVGALLRRSSLDELPQLVNVLRGEMSLVGPRPHALMHDAKYRTLIDAYPLRLHVKPGMTGWAQINGQRGETAQLAQMARRVELDLWYIDNWSPLIDLRILCRTVLEVSRLDAY